MTADLSLLTGYLRMLLEEPNRRTTFLGGGVVVVTDGEIYDIAKENKAATKTLAGLQTMGNEVATAALVVSNELRGPDVMGGAIVIRRHRFGTNNIGDLRAPDLGGLVTVVGLVKSVSKPLPHFLTATFQCQRCGAVHVVPQDGLRKLALPLECFKEGGGCGRAGTSTKFRRATPRGVLNMPDGQTIELPAHVRPVAVDERWLELQEPPGETTAGATPVSILVRAISDRVADEKILPGDIVTVDGVLMPDDEKMEKLAPSTFIEAHNVEVNSQTDTEVDAETMAHLRELAAGADPLTDVVIPSIAPNVICQDDAKAALACHLFGGVSRDLATHRIRGTIHVLFLGDPGTAKSEMMRAVARISPRGFFTNAKSSTQVGLTAAAVQEKEFGEGRWVLRAGPLVLADHGHLGIDEAGELSVDDFKSLEEAMEQQTVTVSKAGIHTVLNARTAVLMAGNPTGGKKWDRTGTLSIQAQVKIPPSTMSRIDLCYIILDDPAKDPAILTRLAQYQGLGEAPPPPPLSERELRAYIEVARSYRPRLTKEAHVIFIKAHAEMRAIPDGPFTIRTYQGYLRIGGALARMRMSNEITEDDAQRAVRIHHAGWKPLIDEYYHTPAPAEVNTPSQRERVIIVKDIIEQYSIDGGVSMGDLNLKAQDRGLTNLDLTLIIERLKKDNVIFEFKNGWFKVV